MKVTTSLLSLCLLIFTIVTSSSCKKIVDEIIKNPNGGVASDCRIDKVITQFERYDYDGSPVTISDTAYFTYNKVGNPIRIRHSSNDLEVGGEKVHLFNQFGVVFKYDKQNRLIACLKGYVRDTVAKVDRADSWKVYSYPDNNTVIEKSYIYPWAWASYGLGDAYESIRAVPDSADRVTDGATINTLDEFGRIKTINVYNRNINYNYDAAGNLIGGQSVYGDKIRYQQTNKVWMFLANNYSVNVKISPLDVYNDEFPIDFNSRKLPTKFQQYPDLVLYTGIYSALSGPATMQYICK